MARKVTSDPVADLAAKAAAVKADKAAATKAANAKVLADMQAATAKADTVGVRMEEITIDATMFPRLTHYNVVQFVPMHAITKKDGTIGHVATVKLCTQLPNGAVFQGVSLDFWKKDDGRVNAARTSYVDKKGVTQWTENVRGIPAGTRGADFIETKDQAVYMLTRLFTSLTA